jgi:DNA-binding NarL/FixJ family response regulator
MPIRVMVADDHAVFRSGLKALLEKDDDIEVVAEAGTGHETYQAVKKLDLDVLILDISMPGISGTRVAELVLEERPNLPIVVLTMHEDEHYLKELFRIGVRAFVLKKSTGTELLEAIRAAHRGEQFVDPSLTGRVLDSYLGRRAEGAVPCSTERLTAREREVCCFLAYGHTNTEIAQKLFISERTVETHRANLMRKLSLKSRADLVRFAIAEGFLKLE